jgi:hypothetical protein
MLKKVYRSVHNLWTTVGQLISSCVQKVHNLDFTHTPRLLKKTYPHFVQVLPTATINRFFSPFNTFKLSVIHTIHNANNNYIYK